ncbi:MAG TPA: alpha/beta hydrolase [Clostridia bacterium]|nr:alpha/beta hydrolase [Clostridia bacterium]
MTWWGYIVAGIAVLAAAGIAYQLVGSARDRRRWPPPGRMVAVNRHRLHAIAAGEGKPTVVFEAALGASSISWALVQPEIAKITGTFAYDRAGMGFSEAGPEPRTAQRIADELHALLEAAEVPKPYVLVGHSYGGLTCRLFAAQHPEEVGGMVVLDPAVAEGWMRPTAEQRRKLWAGAMLARRGAMVAHLGIARLTAALARRGARRSARFAAAAVSGGILAGRSERIIAPMERVPSELRPMLAAIWTQARFYRSLASQIESMPESAAQVATTSLRPYLPLIVMSASSLPDEEVEAHRRLAAQTVNGRHVVVEDSGHWIQLDQPDAVIRAIADVVREARG